MSTQVLVHRRYYAEELVTHACLMYSYAQGATEPVVFAHYDHEHRIPHQIFYANESEMCKVFIFLAGDFDFMGKNLVYRPSYGDVVLASSHEQYTTCFYSQSHVDYYEIAFPVQFFDLVPSPNPCHAPFFEREAGEQNLVTLSRAGSERLISKLREIEWLIKTGNEHVDLLAYSYVLQIMEIIYARFKGSRDQEQVRAVRVPDKLKNAIDYIHSHYLTIISMEEVAAHCGVSNTYLSRMFKNALQCTPNEYLTNMRISHAKYLLSHGSTLTDACYHSGFNNYTYFITKFKNVVGITPAQFKKRA